MACARTFLIGAMIGAAGLLLYANRLEPPSPLHLRADLIVVEKQKHTLTLTKHGTAIATYRVALGHGGLAPKRREGDGLTPEGRYIVDARKADSAFYKALHISYPSLADAAAARTRHAKPGGDIMIHGMRNGLGWIGALHTKIDWTNGCIAVTDSEMDALWADVPVGTPIEIRP